MSYKNNRSLFNQEVLIQILTKAIEGVIMENKEMLTGKLDQKNVPTDEYFSQKEACDFLMIHQSTIIRWRKNNLIPYHRIGKTIMYSKNELVLFAKDKINWK